jgi:hypothetical protein
MKRETSIFFFQAVASIYGAVIVSRGECANSCCSETALAANCVRVFPDSWGTDSIESRWPARATVDSPLGPNPHHEGEGGHQEAGRRYEPSH